MLGKEGEVMLVRGINPGINLRPNPGPGNPISWAERMIMGAEDDLANGVLGGNINPYTARHHLFQGVFLDLGFRNQETNGYAITDANKDAVGKTNNAALPADSPRLLAAA